MRELNKPSLLLGLVWVVLTFIAMRTFLGDFSAEIRVMPRKLLAGKAPLNKLKSR